MNYIKQLNTFFELLLMNPLSPNAQCLYTNLLNINNKCNWKKEFTIANSTLMAFTGLNKQSLYRARNVLIQKELIKFKKGINQTQSGIYEIIEFDTASDTADDTPSDTAPDTATDTNNKLKQNKNNNEQKKILLEHFEKIWNIYPHKKGKAKAQELYLQWVNGRKISDITRKLTDKQMYYAVLKYAKECEKGQIEQQFIKHGDTFFNKAILDYVEEENE